ncbi:MAG: cysteine synthase family protein, partial [Deltaproteobacteria bacterium]|nr:cysteine synthase family protein [Deltaproteobacteria bacterium]
MSLHTRQKVESIVDLVGNTPVVRLRSVEARAGSGAQIWAKCEFENPSGSVKDRAAREIFLDALEHGRLGGGKRLIDATSGNTGVAYSMIGAALGVPVTLVMPANVSVARKHITQAYGTELIYSSELEGSDGAIVLARKLAAEHPDRYYYSDQYSNECNPRAHYQGTGPEIAAALPQISHFVTGVGTSGTLMGTGRFMKDHVPGVEVVGLEPDDAFHGLEGLKHMETSIVPPIWQPDGIVDRMVAIATDDGWDAAEMLVKDEGLFVGHSAGANVAGACKVAAEADPDAVVVTI